MPCPVRIRLREIGHQILHAPLAPLTAGFADRPFHQGGVRPMIPIGQDGELNHLALTHPDFRQWPGSRRGEIHRLPLLHFGPGEPVRDLGRGIADRLFRGFGQRAAPLQLGLGLAGTFAPLFGQGLHGRRGHQRHQIPRLALGFAAREGKTRAVEDAVKRVVILRRDRIVFVIMAPRTPGGEAEEVLAEVVDHILVHQVDILVDVVAKPPRDGEVAGGDDALVAFLLRFIGIHQITGQLQAHKLVIRQIPVKGLHHPVPVAPRLRQGAVRVLARRIRITHHIQPMPSPLHPVVRGGQQAVDDLCPALRRRVSGKGLHLLRRGRQSCEIISGPSDQSAPVRRWVRRQGLGRERFIDESIDLLRGQGRLPLWQRLKGPPIPGFLRFHAAQLRHRPARIRRSHPHPFRQQCDIRLTQLPASLLRRHRQILIPVVDCRNEQGLLRFSRHHRRSRVAALLPAFPRIQGEAALGLFAAVAFITTVHQQRPDLRFKELLPCPGPGRRRSAQQCDGADVVHTLPSITGSHSRHPRICPRIRRSQAAGGRDWKPSMICWCESAVCSRVARFWPSC